MTYKLCPTCNQASYSAYGRSIWFCPYCGCDITFIQGMRSESEILANVDRPGKTAAPHLRLLNRESK
ncbi:MAG: hypothetical protein FWF85_03335 [Clostridiales bacterium]|nr:hypothetical protein [Clostridiales bacterium]MDR2713046.1 hypothetical protein [Clostridiales bacterium]